MASPLMLPLQEGAAGELLAEPQLLAAGATAAEREAAKRLRQQWIAALRPADQLRVMRGSARIVGVSVVLAVLTCVYAVRAAGQVGIILVLFSTSPAAVILLWLRCRRRHEVRAELLAEIFWLGAVLSVGFAMALESFSTVATPFWQCSAGWPMAVCCIRFVFVVTICIGFVEELAKALPLAFVKTSESEVPFTCIMLYRLAATPHAYAMTGAAAAAGFATAENIGYVLMPGSFGNSVAVSIARALTSVPLHLACTVYVSAALAAIRFAAPPAETTEGVALRPLAGTAGATEPQEQLSAAPRDYARSPVPPPAAAAEAPRTTPRLREYLTILAVPAVVHGVYDTSLLLSSKMPLRHDAEVGLSLSGWRLLTAIPAAAAAAEGVPPELLPAEVAAEWVLGSMAIAAYVTIVVLAVRAWKRLAPLGAPTDARARDHLVGGSLMVVHPYDGGHGARLQPAEPQPLYDRQPPAC